MEIIQASVLGFCFGVRRAVEVAEKALIENPHKKVYSLGPLIHNESALKRLEEKGLIILEENQLENLPEESVVIIRAHGVSPKIIEVLEQKKSTVVDATCPRVKANQKMVSNYSENKDLIILTGDKNHGEVRAIAGYAENKFLNIQDQKEAADFKELPEEKTALLLSQTTFSVEEFNNISEILSQKIHNLEIKNTICSATKERQDSLLELCKKVDGILVIGGLNSANTIRLFELAKENCNKAAHIQSAEDIPEEFYKLKSVGITAGASTPDDIISAVKQRLSIKQVM